MRTARSLIWRPCCCESQWRWRTALSSMLAASQETNVRAVADWAAQNNLPTIDVYGGWPVDQGQRDALLEADGSPTLEGSRLFARIVAEALTPA